MNPIRLRWRRLVYIGPVLLILFVYTFYQIITLENIKCIEQNVEIERVRILSRERKQLLTSAKPTQLPVETRDIVRSPASRNNQYFSKLLKLSKSELENNKIENIIHYVWCHNRTLHFENYLSILSAWKVMQPNGIELHTMHDIPTDEDKYNFWLRELKTTIPGFVVRKITNSVDCGVVYGLDVLYDRGGIYFSENLFVMLPFRDLKRKEFSVAFYNEGRNISFIMSEEHQQKGINVLRRKLVYDKTPGIMHPQPLLENSLICEYLDKSFNIVSVTSLCAEMPPLVPKDIMFSNTTFAAKARFILYGDSNMAFHVPKLPGIIPKIVHLVWYNKKEMDFMMYLCLRSILTILLPEKVFIHGDGYLEGKYVEKFKRDPKVIWVRRERPSYIFGKTILYTQHKSDIIRADVLLKYGGIYTDWDVLWLRPIDDLINTGYDAILNFDHMPWPDYPDAFNLGVLMAKPGSSFVKSWQSALVNYRSRDFYYNALLLPYKTYERDPYAVHIEKKLQVMCYQLKCHPTFQNGFKDYNLDQPFKWRDVYSIHFTYPDPPEYSNETALSKGNGRFAEIGKFIMSKKYQFD